MAFDPDKFLAETAPAAPAAGGFDPDKFLAETAPQAEGPGEIESGARGLAQGATFGFADELSGGAEALWDKLKGADTPFAEAYRKHRDESRANFKAAEDANPTAFTVGKVAGGVGSGLATGGGSTLAGALAVGGGSAALNALGESNELDANAAADALKQGAVGALTGGAGHGVGKLVSKGINAATEALAPKAATAFEDLAVATGNRAVRGGATGSANQLERDQILRALEEGHIGYGDNIKNIAEKLGGARQQAGEYTQGLVEALESRGVKGPDARALAEKWLAEATELDKSSLGSPVPGLMRDRAEELMSKVPGKFEGEWPAGDWAHPTSLSQAVDMKRELQSAANYGREAPKALEEGRRALASDMRQAIEDRVTGAAKANPGDEEMSTLASNFTDANKRNGDLIALSNAANRGQKLTDSRGAVGPIAKLAGVAGLAAGSPLAMAGAVGKHLYDTRGQATLARAAFDLSKSLGKVGKVALTNPAKLGRYGSVLASAAQRGQDALNSAHFVLGQSDPEYQKTVAELEDEP